MMAQPYPAHAGMGPGHPGMPHGHPMGGVHHPGGQMGHPNPAMMQGMHPGVSGPQVTQGPMATGMPPNPGTPAPGGPMQTPMAMAHLQGPQGPMFQGQNPQMNLGQMQMNQAQMIAARQKAMMAQQGGQMPHGMMNVQNMPQFNPAQIAQMRMGMPMQQMGHMTPQQQAFQQQQQFNHQQRLMAQQAAAQQNAIVARAQQQQQANVAQQMQMSRSQEPSTQPPQSQPTPAPQAPPQPQPQPNNQPQQPPPQPQKAQPQPPSSQPQQPQNAPTPQVKQGEPEEETQIKPEGPNQQQILMQDLSKQQDFTGQCILQLLLYQDNLANPEEPNNLAYWDRIIQKYFSPFGSIRQQVFNQKTQSDKSFQLQFPSLARFYHSHFKNGIRQILMQSFDHNQSKLPNGGVHIWSEKASLTYVFRNDLRITTQGSLRVNFDDMQKIEHLNIATNNWVEYIPRTALLAPMSPEQSKQSPKLKKNQQKGQQQRPGQSSPNIPSTGCTEYGLPGPLIQFLEIAEVMTAMGPLMLYFHEHPGLGPRESLMGINQENNAIQASIARQNAGVMAANGQMQFANQRMGMNMPNQFQSPALSHLNLPQGQGSPHMGGPNHTPSPAQNQQGGVAMMHQMSAQGSNMSGSAGASQNTSPNVSTKRRRASAIKAEDENPIQGPDGKVKPSPRIGGKRQKGAAS